MRQYFKTCKVHHCFSQELSEPKPEKCRCRKFISKEFAAQLVADGVADYLIKYPEGIPAYDVVLKGRAGKTPRTPTLEKAHIERFVDYTWSPDINDDENDVEISARFDEYQRIVIESRLKLFGSIGCDLIEHKKFSDTHGVLEGESGRVLADKIVQQADDMKKSVAIDDPFVGHAIFNPIGGDQRTCIGKDVPVDEKKLDKDYDSW